jgi:vacuolar-type H+-ATPase subunit H
MAQDPEQLEREIEETRRNLGQNVDALADKVSPSRVVERRVEGAKSWVSNTKDKIMGSGSDDTSYADSYGTAGTYERGAYDTGSYDTGGGVGDRARGAASSVGDKVSGAASSVSDTVSDAPQKLRQRTEGNPLAAGLIAFGVGWLASTLIPSSRVEQQAATQVKDKAQPLVEQAKEQAQQVVSDVKDELQPKAQEAAQSVKDSASSAASSVQDQAKESGQKAADDAKSTAKGSSSSGSTSSYS